MQALLRLWSAGEHERIFPTCWYDGKRFIPRENVYGRAGPETVFSYSVDQDGAITGSYSGGETRVGHLLGKVVGDDRIQLLFQCITTDGELLAGRSKGVVSREGGRNAALDFAWARFSGREGGGISRYVELPEAEVELKAEVH